MLVQWALGPDSYEASFSVSAFRSHRAGCSPPEWSCGQQTFNSLGKIDDTTSWIAIDDHRVVRCPIYFFLTNL